jgi:hypothetical protein
MKIFLSHASQDKALAESIAFSLRGRGHKVFLDRDNLPPSGSYDNQIESAINDSETFVFLISPESVADGRYTLTELTFARRKWPDPNGRVLPVMVRKTPLEEIPPYLRAVSFLEPVGNITAETSSAVHNMRPLRRRWDVPFVHSNVLGLGSSLGIGAALAFVLITLIVGRPSVNGWDGIGLGVPFYLAAATYCVFYWLDNNASDNATQVISSWLHGRAGHKPDFGNLIINAFDRIYTSPLLSFRAFRRSAAISSIIWLVIIIIHKLWKEYPPAVIAILAIFLFITVLSDYLSLPFARWYLRVAKIYPIRASFISSIVGLVVVTVCLFICIVISGMAIYLINPDSQDYGAFDKDLLVDFFGAMFKATLFPTFIVAMRPSFVIHLWLPLFAVSLLAVRLVYLSFRAVERAQWFLKQGDAHPFRAIGIVATIIVFGGAMLAKEAWALV